VNVRFVFAVRNVSGRFNLVDAHYRGEGEKTIPKQLNARMLKQICTALSRGVSGRRCPDYRDGGQNGAQGGE
jgi:hypothetical protein